VKSVFGSNSKDARPFEQSPGTAVHILLVIYTVDAGFGNSTKYLVLKWYSNNNKQLIYNDQIKLIRFNAVPWRDCLDWLGYLPYTQVVMGSNPIPSMLVMDIRIFFISSKTMLLPKNDNDHSEDLYSE
jgi:hypothetical protein